MISTTLAGSALIVIFALLFIFHILVLLGLIPHDIVWAGKIKDRKGLVQLESVSLLILLIASGIVALKMGCFNLVIKPFIADIGIWILVVFFAMNTLGNLTAKNPIEKYGFGALTLIISLLALRLALGN